MSSLRGKHYVQNCIFKKKNKKNIILKTRYITIYLSFHEKIILKFAIFMSINDVYNLYDV